MLDGKVSKELLGLLNFGVLGTFFKIMKLIYFCVIEKGLPPIPEPKEDNVPADSTQSSSKESSSKSSASQGLSFSSSSRPSTKSNKRKLDELRDGVMKEASSDEKAKSKNPQKGGGSASVKKAKKSNKTQLLSFGDDT